LLFYGLRILSYGSKGDRPVSELARAGSVDHQDGTSVDILKLIRILKLAL